LTTTLVILFPFSLPSKKMEEEKKNEVAKIVEQHFLLYSNSWQRNN
jgi:hypothetical protein